MNLAEKIFSLRKQNNLSQEQLAEKLGVSRQAVSKWEAGQATPDIDKIINISELFGVSTDYLLKEKDEGGDKVSIIQSTEIQQGKLSYPKIVGIVLLLISLVSFVAAFFVHEYNMPVVVIFGLLLLILSLELLLIPKVSSLTILWTIWGYCFLFITMFLAVPAGLMSIIVKGTILITGFVLLSFTVKKK
jgi:transcriptional regulator with XRE-family HTH domain